MPIIRPLMEVASPADVRVVHHAILPTKAVFSLNFSSAAKGPFIASKTMCTLLGEGREGGSGVS